jgi:hypothetical protein
MAASVGGRLALGLARFCALAAGYCVWITAIALAAFTAVPGRLSGLAVFVCGLCLAPVADQLGQLIAAPFAGVRITTIYLGGPPSRVTFRVGGTQLGLGIRPGYSIRIAGSTPPGRRAVTFAAGPLANLLIAVAALSAPAPHWASRPTALLFGGAALMSLIPTHHRGESSTGTLLLELAAEHAAQKHAQRLIAAPDWMQRPGDVDLLLDRCQRSAHDARRVQIIGRLLSQQDRTDELLRLHAQDCRLSRRPASEAVVAVSHLEWRVLLIPGLSVPAADLAAARLEWAVKHSRRDALPAVKHSLAVARLRQHRFADVEPLCTAALADKSAEARATFLATVAMARQALGEDSARPLQEALRLDPAAELVEEAAALLRDPAPPDTVTTVQPAASGPPGRSRSPLRRRRRLQGVRPPERPASTPA